MLDQRRASVYTVADNTQNHMTMLNLAASHWVSDQLLLTGLIYHRVIRTRARNGDVNDDFEGGANDGSAGVKGGAGFNADTAVSNRTSTDQTGDGAGAGLQGSSVLDKNTLAVGTTYDQSRSDFDQSAQRGIFRSATDRSVPETDTEDVENSLKGRALAVSLYATDTWSIPRNLPPPCPAAITTPR